MLKTTLLMLTVMAGGDLRVTLSPAADEVECEANRDAVVTILADAGRAPLAALCGASDLRLTPFVHGTPPEAEVHRYRVELPLAGGFSVTPLLGDAPCTAAPKAEPAVYCARSAQTVLPAE